MCEGCNKTNFLNIVLNTSFSSVITNLTLREPSLCKDIFNTCSYLSWFTIGILPHLIFHFDPFKYHHSHFFSNVHFFSRAYQQFSFCHLIFLCLSSFYRKTLCKVLSLLFLAWPNVTLYFSLQLCLASVFTIFTCICHSVRNVFISNTSI